MAEERFVRGRTLAQSVPVAEFGAGNEDGRDEQEQDVGATAEIGKELIHRSARSTERPESKRHKFRYFFRGIKMTMAPRTFHDGPMSGCSTNPPNPSW